MAMEFKLEGIEKLEKALRKSPEAVGQQLHETLEEVRKDWRLTAGDIAPIDSGNLRRTMRASVKGDGLSSVVEIRGNAGRTTGFNYGYYIHEHNAGGNNINGEAKFFDVSAETNKDKWADWMRKDIDKVVKPFWR